MNWFARKSSGMIVDRLKKIYKKYKDSDWEKYYNRQKDFYDWMYKRIDAWEKENLTTE